MDFKHNVIHFTKIALRTLERQEINFGFNPSTVTNTNNISNYPIQSYHNRPFLMSKEYLSALDFVVPHLIHKGSFSHVQPPSSGILSPCPTLRIKDSSKAMFQSNCLL